MSCQEHLYISWHCLPHVKDVLNRPSCSRIQWSSDTFVSLMFHTCIDTSIIKRLHRVIPWFKAAKEGFSKNFYQKLRNTKKLEQSAAAMQRKLFNEHDVAV